MVGFVCSSSLPPLPPLLPPAAGATDPWALPYVVAAACPAPSPLCFLSCLSCLCCSCCILARFSNCSFSALYSSETQRLVTIHNVAVLRTANMLEVVVVRTNW